LIFGTIIAVFFKVFEPISYIIVGFVGGYFLSIYFMIIFSYTGLTILFYFINFVFGVLSAVICIVF